MTKHAKAALAAFASVIALSACRDANPADLGPSPTSIVATSDLRQEAIVNRVVASTPTVRVLDQSGQPMSGATVLFDGNGIASQTVTTAADGTASIAWRLASVAGTQTLVAKLSNTARAPYGPSVTFVANAVADTLAAIEPASVVSQLGLASRPVSVRPSVVAIDAFGNAKAGIAITFTVTAGGGVVDPSTTVTDSNGRATASVWTLGPDVGTDTVLASTTNLTPVVFAARVSPPFFASAVVSGLVHSCAIDMLGATFCWGGNSIGQVNGDGAPAWHVPQRVAVPPLVSLAAGPLHTCGISNEIPSQAYCWGDTTSGQLGGIGAGPVWGPVRVPVSGGLTAVVAGISHSCGLTPSGAAYCWGDDTWGQLGNGGLVGRAPTPVVGDMRFVALAAGASHTCGLTAAGQVACWGLDDQGQLGAVAPFNCVRYDYSYYYYYAITPVSCALTPQIIPFTPGFVAISAGAGTCGLTVGLEVVCYGFQSSPSAVTVAAGAALHFTQLSAGGRCGLTGEQLVYCWTPTFDSPTSRLSGPIAEGDSLAFVAAAIGQMHMCGILAKDRSVVCWGTNDAGQLGNGMPVNSAHPVPVAPPFP